MEPKAHTAATAIAAEVTALLDIYDYVDVEEMRAYLEPNGDLAETHTTRPQAQPGS
jgi:hypothetical protein